MAMRLSGALAKKWSGHGLTGWTASTAAQFNFIGNHVQSIALCVFCSFFHAVSTANEVGANVPYFN